MSTLVAGFADTHSNSTVGLCPPVVNLDDGGTYRASDTQRAMWTAWMDYWSEMKAIQADRKIGVWNGDAGELDTKRRSYQIITANKATIEGIARQVLEPVLDVVDALIIMRGTKAHSGKSSWLEESIAQDIDCVIPNNSTAAAWWHFRGKIDKVRFDITHHQPMGGIPRTEKSYIDRLTYDTIWRYIWEMNEKPPDLIWRAHQHRYVSTGDKWHNDYFKVTGISMPGWQVKTEWIYRIGQENARVEVGGVWALCDNGKYTHDKLTYTVKPRRVWSKSI